MQPIDKDFTPVEYDPQYILMVNQLKNIFPSKAVWSVKPLDRSRLLTA